MKLFSLLLIFIICIIPALGQGLEDNFDYMITVETSESAILHSLELPDHVYQNVYSPTLSDIAVINVAGESVPFVLQRPAPNRYYTPEAEDIPFYPIYQDVSVDNSTVKRMSEIIIDLTELGELPSMFEFKLKGTGSLNSNMVVYGSKGDLGSWSRLRYEANIARLVKDGEPTVVYNKINTPKLDPELNYVKFTSSYEVLESVDEIWVHFPEVAVYDDNSRWVESKGQRTEEGVVFEVDGFYPMENVLLDIQPSYLFPYYNVKYRNKADERWSSLISRGYIRQTTIDYSSYLNLSDTRAKYWLISTEDTLPAEVNATFDWRPDTLVFIEKGGGPYTMLYGSKHYRYDESAARSVALLSTDNTPNLAEVNPPSRAGDGTKPFVEPVFEEEKSKLPLYLMMVVILAAVIFLSYTAIKLMKDVNKNK